MLDITLRDGSVFITDKFEVRDNQFVLTGRDGDILIDVTDVESVGPYVDNNYLTPEQFYNKMMEISESDDIEFKHMDADNLMCDLLRYLGYCKGVEEFISMDRWYA